ncbi:MAG: hypothetical protein M1834_006472 [Cirrosporium novae-zelandiae]|nr:MAG: hypothetical protein M1834_006472 [Cirrosporium novae-zelandiae]
MENQLNDFIKRHPLQRIASPSRTISLALHKSPCAKRIDNRNDSYGWHFQYLTILGLSLATLTFLFGSLADISLSRSAFFVKNALSILSTPLEVLISILYWGLRAVRIRTPICSVQLPNHGFEVAEADVLTTYKQIDTKLVIPDWAEPITIYADVGFHLMPAFVLSLDLLFLSPPWTITALPSIAVSTIFAFAYWGWVEVCYTHNGWYPYPIFELLEPKIRGLLFAGSAIVMATSTATLKWIYGRVNGKGEVETK